MGRRGRAGRGLRRPEPGAGAPDPAPRSGALDPATGEVLPTWDQALDKLPDEPHHVARFGERFDAQGVLAASTDAARCIGYLTKYLTKQVWRFPPRRDRRAAGACGPAGRGAAVPAVLADLREPAAIRHPAQECPALPSPWPVQGRGPHGDHPGYAGRGVLVSRKWSGKTLADHRVDRQEWLLSARWLMAR